MPPKRRADEAESPNNPSSVPLGRRDAPAPAAQAAPVKRQRVSRACDQCRAARERCDGKQPECYPCISQSRPCTYEVSPKKRGVQTGYIRTLELALGWVFEEVPGTEQALGALLAHEGGQRHPILAGKDPGGAERLQKRWRKSRVHSGIDRILSGETAPSPPQDEISPSVDASDAEGDAVRTASNPDTAEAYIGASVQEAQDAQPERAGNRPSTSGSQEPPCAERQRRVPPGRSVDSGSSLPVLLKLPPNYWRLLDVYFSYTHSWLPILDKRDLFQSSYLYPKHGIVVDPQAASSAVHAELWAALALASLQDAASSKLSASDTVDPAGHTPSEIYDTARGLFPSENGPFQARHARAFLLLSLVNLGLDKLTGAGLLIGTAIRILLDPDTARCGGRDREGENTKLTLMSCFLVDTVLSVRCNRPPHLRAEDLADVPLASEGTLDQWEPWTPCDGFGTCRAGPRSSRSSAFCLSTFNQLYAIMKVVARQTSLVRWGPPMSGESGGFLTQLQQAIDPNLPFAHFVVSPCCGTSSVPTPYVARAAYLWAGTLADLQSEAFPSLLHDTLDQYQRLFGKCGMPPFISACIASLANDELLSGCSEQTRERLRGLVSTYSSRRFKQRPPSSSRGCKPNLVAQAAQEPREMPGSTLLPSPNYPTMSYPAPAMPSLYHKESASQQAPQYSEDRRYNSFPDPGIVGPYQRPLAGSSGLLPQLSQGNNIQLPLGAAVGSLPGLGAAIASARHNHPASHPFNPPAAFGGTPDYDALLDDLASIECTDAIGVDPQFMTNLGFAPGCDIAELLARDFGPV